MPEPQPGADRPVDGNLPDPHRDGEPAVTQEQSPSPVPPSGGPRTGPDGTHELSTDPPEAGDQPTPQNRAEATERSTGQLTPAPDEPATAAAGEQPTRPATSGPDEQATRPTTAGQGDDADDAPADDQRPGAVTEVGPQGTRVLPDPLAADEVPAPRWSGSAPVPPPPPRRHGWGESAEPTPPPPAPAPQPEHQTPVDPWAGVDTSGWELPSADFPALPPTLSYPAPPPTRPYSGPPAPPVSPAPPAVQPTPGAHPPPPPPGAHQLRPPPAAHLPPASLAPQPPMPAAPMRPGLPAYPPPVAHPPARPISPVAHPPAPVPPPPARERLGKKARPVAPPPGWQAPPGYVPVAVRKRRRWPWVLLLTLACCCGCPAYYGMPMATQYPASAALPAQVADLRLHDDARSTQVARQLETQMRQAHLLAEDTFAGIYTTRAGKQVTVFGGTGFRLTPSADADAEIDRLTEQYALGETQVVESSVRGRHERCAVGHSDGVGVVVCTSVDHGSITSAVFTGLSVDDSARLLGTLRENIVTTDG